MTNQHLSANPALIVPMDIAALLVGNNDVYGDASVSPRFGTTNFAAVAADFSQLPNADSEHSAYLSENVLPAPFQTQSDALQPGVHLHFALPDSLARGETDDQGQVLFRQAPNRFLIVRIASRQSISHPAARIAAWVVQGDHLWEESDSYTRGSDPRNRMSRALPTKPEPDNLNAPTHRFLGRVVRYSDWSELVAPNASSHTAVGYGAPDFAAAYAHAPNVFGFFDPASGSIGDDLASGLSTDYPAGTSRLSYLVVGWFSDPAQDPLTAVAAAAKKAHDKTKAYSDAFASILKQTYGWTYDAASGAVPERTLCVGVLTDITWDPALRYIHPRPNNSPLEVAIGPTAVEALSALLASKRTDLPNLETVLNALQYGQLQQFEADALDGLANLQDGLHQRGFTTFASGDENQPRPADAAPDLKTAGVLYTVKRKSPADPLNAPRNVGIQDDDLRQIAVEVGLPLPEDVATALNSLNRAQAAFDDLSLEIRIRRSQIFCDWYKYIVVFVHRDSDQPLDVNNLIQYLKLEIGALKKQVELLTARRAERDGCLTTLATLLDHSYKGQYLLQSATAPRFYQAADPVLLLSGPDVTPSFRHGGDGRYSDDASLPCRLSADSTRLGNLVSTLTIAAERYGEAITISGDKLPTLPSSPNQATNPQLAAQFAALLADALFLDSGLAWQLAAIARSGDASLVTEIQAAQAALLAAPLTPRKAQGTVSFAGVAPSPEGLQRHSMPWIPLLLQWEASFQPFMRLPAESVEATYPVDWVTSNFRLDANDVENVYQAAPPPLYDSQAETYRGTVVLAHNTEINLKAQIDNYLNSYPDDPNGSQLTQIRDKLDFAMMAQALSGFHRALLMRKQTLQLPVFNPRLPDPVQTNRCVAPAVDHCNDAVGLPENNYNPLRAGMLTLTRLRLVDAFGQIRDIGDPGIAVPLIRSVDLVPPAHHDGRAAMALRITQPARLSFRYLAADLSHGSSAMEMNSDTASTPVLGWVLFNRLDNSLIVYDADGTPRGSFNEYGLFWQGAPASEATFEQPIEAAFKGANVHLCEFVNELSRRGRKFLSALLRTLDNSAGRIAPASYAQDDALALLISRPFALIRASLSLDLYGSMPAVSQSYSAMEATIDNAGESVEPDARNGDGRYAAAFQQVRFPVRLGDITRINDGLVGYYVETDEEKPYAGTLWAASAPLRLSEIQTPPSNGPITLAAADPKPTIVTMIVDPRAPINAITGILPAKQITLPPAHYARALKRIAVTFLTAPVLGHAEQMALPLPNEIGHEWSWLTAKTSPTDTVRKWTEQKPIRAPNLRAAFADLPQQIVEGWLRLVPAEKQGDVKKA
jgi:hypothetical protein